MEEIGQLVAGLESFVRNYGAFAVMPILAIEAVGAPSPRRIGIDFCVSVSRTWRDVVTVSLDLRVGWLGGRR